MPRALSDRSSRSEFAEKDERLQKDMQDREIDLDRIAADVETVRQTLESLDLIGTSEGADAVGASVHRSEDVTETVFDGENEELESTHAESEDYQGEVQERQNADNDDLEKISEASGRIDTRETINELTKAKDAALEDVEFLAEQIRRAQDARERSEQVQQELQNRVHHGR